MLAGLLGFAQIPSSTAAPANHSSVTISHSASDHFPHAKSNMSKYDISAEFIGYDAEKAQIMLSVAYAKPFDATDPDMIGDRNNMLSAVSGNITSSSISKRQGSEFVVNTSHAVVWGLCSGILSCLSGTTCTFNRAIDQAPRSTCVSAAGGQSCCLSWSAYNVEEAFFQTTWTSCNSEVEALGVTSASCQGYGFSSEGGDVCLSNRADGCN